MKRPHADLIHAWADGAELQLQCSDEHWYDVSQPVFKDGCKYRIKPKKLVLEYKRYVCLSHGEYCVTAVSRNLNWSVESSDGFFRWIDAEWQEYEVEGE